MRLLPSNAVAITSAPKWASAPSTRALAPGMPCSMRFFRSSGPTHRLRSIDARVERHVGAEAARGVELAVGVRVDLGRVARAGEGPVRDRERADALEEQDVGPVPHTHHGEARDGLHGTGRLRAGGVVLGVGPVRLELEAGAAVAAEDIHGSVGGWKVVGGDAVPVQTGDEPRDVLLGGCKRYKVHRQVSDMVYVDYTVVMAIVILVGVSDYYAG